jgi:hypothetical protein
MNNEQQLIQECEQIMLNRLRTNIVDLFKIYIDKEEQLIHVLKHNTLTKYEIDRLKEIRLKINSTLKQIGE